MIKRTIYSYFKEIVRKYLENNAIINAIIEEDRTLSFSQLDRMVDDIAVKFYDRQPESVGIVMHHGVEHIAGGAEKRSLLCAGRTLNSTGTYRLNFK